MRILLWIGLALVIASCARQPLEPSRVAVPALGPSTYLTSDGVRLPLHRWLPTSPPKAVIVALHGFNDYGRFIETPADYFTRHGIAVYSYDQRGFGANPDRGRWAGVESYSDDLKTLTALIRQRHPDIPLYVLGESMGGAIAIVAATSGLAHTDGLILASPAVWARWTMPWYQRSLLWLGDHLAPGMELTGNGLGIQPSDNLEMLRALGRDPLVIKATRIDAVAGLTDLMDQAQAAAPRLRIRTLYLYGGRDQLVPRAPTLSFLNRTDTHQVRLAWYDGAYHMLLRDLEASRYWRDILSWIENSGNPLPSGADRHGEVILSMTNRNRTK